uniref:Uncharacterized protein n=1 Tax=Glossina pallidipes TaxID=7398 RepID=A0A1B0A3L9_GLOPL
MIWKQLRAGSERCLSGLPIFSDEASLRVTDDNVSRLGIADEIWLYTYDSEAAQQLNECRTKGGLKARWWSLQSDANNTTNDPTPITANSSKSVWSCSTVQNPSAKADPFEMLFGNSSITNAVNTQLDSGTLSAQSSQPNRDNDELVTPLYSVCHEEIYHRILNILKSNCLEEDDVECLRQVLALIQQFGMSCTPQSGPASLNASSSCSDETNSLDLVKSRSSDYSSGSSTSSSARSVLDNGQHVASSKSNTSTTQSRIIATVQPYHSIPPYQYNNNNNNNSNSNFNNSQSFVPHNTPTDSPRKIRYHQPWQSNSLSESGVFVESDFLSDTGDNHVGTQTDCEDRLSLVSSPVKFTHPQLYNSTHYKTPALQLSPNLSDQKRLQYYQDRLTLLEGKIFVYESSGDIQTKRLADRLQREIQLGKEVKELKDRVESLLQENLILEEEKCEFEEAENDTRLRLQRLEVELEILSQRNVELDVSREALSAKYKDCHSECLILRDDLAASETQIRHLEEDKQKAKENFEFLHNLLPILLLSNSLSTLAFFEKSAGAGATNSSIPNDNQVMGSKMSQENGSPHIPQRFAGGETRKDAECGINKEHELHYLREEVKCLRHQMKEMNSRHYAAMESADCHWVELERQYKEREDQYLAKEICLKQKIQKLQDCIKDDTKSANDKICLLEEAERGLKTCLLRVTKEHRELVEDHKQLLGELEELKEQHEATLNNQKPLLDALEQEKKRNKNLIDELSFLTRLQQETENQNKSELECVRSQLHDIKKEFLHVDVTNAELKEEVSTLEQQVLALQNTVHDYEDRTRCLTDEIRNKDEQVQKLEKRIQRTEADSLADELGDTSSRRLQRDKIKDLKTANRFLKKALHNMKDCENPTPEVKQFSEVATEVSRLAKWMLREQKLEEDEVGSGASIDMSELRHNEANVNVKSEENISLEENIKQEEDELPEDDIPPLEVKKEEIKDENDNENREEGGREDVLREGGGREGDVREEGGREECGREEGGREEGGREGERVEAFIGIALVPEFIIDENFLPSCSNDSKKVICEVPSELRKLSTAPTLPKVEAILQNSERSSRHIKKKHNIRSIKRRMIRGRVNCLNARLRRIVSCINARQSGALFQDASDLDICESEVLQRNLSYESFHSISEEALELPEKVDVSTETEIINQTVGTATETSVAKADSSVQVNDELAVQGQMDCIPAHIRCFLSMLKASAPRSQYSSNLFNMRLCQYWKTSREFRDGLEILAAFAAFKSEDPKNISLENYEDFVNAMSCMHFLHELFKPTEIPMLKQLEEKLNESLMIFHNRKMESEFYCTVYYPVKRPASSEHQHQEQEHGRHRAERDWARLDPGKLWTQQDQGQKKYSREFLAESK